MKVLPLGRASPNPDGMLVFMLDLNLAITTWNLMAKNPVLQASPNPEGMLVFMPAPNPAITYLEFDGQKSCSSGQP